MFLALQQTVTEAPLILMGCFMVLWSMLEFFSSICCGFERMDGETVSKGVGRRRAMTLR